MKNVQIEMLKIWEKNDRLGRIKNTIQNEGKIGKKKVYKNMVKWLCETTIKKYIIDEIFTNRILVRKMLG